MLRNHLNPADFYTALIEEPHRIACVEVLLKSIRITGINVMDHRNRKIMSMAFLLMVINMKR